MMSMNAPRLGDLYPSARADLPPLFMRFHWPCKDGQVTWAFGGAALAGFVASTKALVEMANRYGMAMDLKDYDWTTFDMSTLSQEEYNRVGEIFTKFLETRTKAELYEEAVQKGIYLSPIGTTKDLVENAQLADRGFWEKVEHPELGDAITYPGAFLTLSEAPWRVWHRPPLIGEHNEEIYVEELGLSRERVLVLKQAGVI